jgi:hypothetical protein
VRLTLTLAILGAAGCSDPDCDPPAEMICGASTDSMAVVRALSGERPRAGVTVWSHRADGSVISSTVTDGQGCASVAREPDALVSLVYSYDPGGKDVVTTLAPAAGELVVHGLSWTTPMPSSSCIAGRLRIVPEAPVEPGRYSVYLGCKWFEITNLPATIDVPVDCMGSDTMVDAVVSSPSVSSVSRADLATGSATITASWYLGADPWGPSGGPVSIVFDPSLTPSGFGVALFVDGVEFQDYFHGLPVDLVRVNATLEDPDGSTRRWMRKNVSVQLPMDLPSPVGVDVIPTDFLPTIDEGNASFVDRDRLAVQWTPEVEVPSDAVTLTVQWYGGIGRENMRWRAVLPPESTGVTFPQIVDDGLRLPDWNDASHPVSTQRAHIDGDTVGGYVDLLNLGLEVDDTMMMPLEIPMVRMTMGRIY